MKINVWHSIEQRTIDTSMTSGIHESKHAYMPNVDIFNTWHKLAEDFVPQLQEMDS